MRERRGRSRHDIEKAWQVRPARPFSLPLPAAHIGTHDLRACPDRHESPYGAPAHTERVCGWVAQLIRRRRSRGYKRQGARPLQVAPLG